MERDELPVGPPAEKLRLMKSPIRDEDDETAADSQASTSRSTSDLSSGLCTRPSNPRGLERIGYRYEPGDTPVLRRNHDATNLEVLYDLFLPRYVVLQIISTGSNGAALLWMTWFLTSSYDVRFVTDSIFERCCRAIHLGVLVGFVTVSPNFDIAQQDFRVFQTFSTILMVSRLCLGFEFGSICLQAWKYKKTRWHLSIVSFLNFVNAFIYLGISFRFRQNSDRLFVSWYVVCIVEIITVIGTSVLYPILSFQSTPIMRRLSLLMLIIFGEGIAVACSNITQVINADGHSAWSPNTIGTVTACISITYLAFMLYFDSLNQLYLTPWRQLAWTALHFPLHLCLTLFTEGCGQFIVFWKTTEAEAQMTHEWQDLIIESLSEGPEDFSVPYRDWLDEFFDRYPPSYYAYRVSVNQTLEDLRSVNVTRINEIIELENLTTSEELVENPEIKAVLQKVLTMMYAAFNVVFSSYGLNYFEEEMGERGIGGVSESAENAATLDFNVGVTGRVFYRVRVVFQYAFVCGGAFLALTSVLYAIARAEKWTRWAVVRTVINLVVGLGIGNVAWLSQSNKSLAAYLFTPWILPTVALTFFIVLVMNHIPEELASCFLPSAECLGRRSKRSEDEERNRPQK